MSRLTRDAADPQVYRSIAVGEPGEMARALVRHAETSGYAKRLHVVGDRRGMGESARGEARTWWIVPARRPPIYRYGKIVVTSRYGASAGKGGVAASLFVGLCMQKGLDPRASQPAGDRSERARTMTGRPRWVWEDFLPEMAAGYIDPLAAMAEDLGGCPLTVVLDARDLRAEDAAETIAFEWSRGQMVPLSSPHRRGRGHLREFASASALATLARRLRYAPQCRGLWLELSIGFQLWVNRTRPGTLTWDERQIWECACRPWSLWLR